MLEREFQADTIKRIRRLLPGAVPLKNDSGYIQGVPDFTIFYGCAWAWLEFKKAANAPVQPNQEYYIALANGDSFGAFIYPENRDEVLNEMIGFLKAQNNAGRWP